LMLLLTIAIFVFNGDLRTINLISITKNSWLNLKIVRNVKYMHSIVIIGWWENQRI
jgi:hypothetical protein